MPSTTGVRTPPAEQIREVCHELRQPVAGVLALTAAALTEPDVPPAIRTRLEQIAQQAEWLADVIEQWLTGDGGPPPADQTDLVRVVNEAAAAERLTWPGEITVSWGEPVRVAVHPVLVRRLLSSVLGNATRAAGPAGRVLITVDRDDRWATIAVEDSGPGFGRIAPGSGVGLVAAARAVARCGGRLECGAAATGGVRVSLRLPCSPPAGHDRIDVADCS